MISRISSKIKNILNMIFSIEFHLQKNFNRLVKSYLPKLNGTRSSQSERIQRSIFQSPILWITIYKFSVILEGSGSEDDSVNLSDLTKD